MSQITDSREGLQFFGRVSASVSHEIKNVFAVINEAAGLIQDFTLMAERGMPLEPERLKKAADSIQGQVQRGDAIVKNMNAMAHSTDDDLHEINIVETLELTMALATRMADMKQVRLTVGDCEPCSMTTDKFDLMRLLHSSLAAVIETMESGENLIVGVTPTQNGAKFVFSISGKGAPEISGIEELARKMNAAVAKNDSNGTVELLFV
ncbi:histidine kinase dimerization/phospho-acceptor domain-containing protein [uncultured Pseudodesulfovibrio sp.]|uniref:histidine kinase dimerization/phospho-acceptor domain-containing protein n=1 Tax=uncultured Pseudodesulfovibrio sp. TaxID=2035858 RepID=UPI0029C8ED32|nr:histidine kinase dimerization/phospho-acceptor domain-containing protein [uncultured Pseudodesulfovibrio sp.]